ncbi:hypothetical protein [Oceanobacillus jeddahense]|uniref:hypothetical protein n=1 Tax=Oceanobacillus jeddahense TaxID=1462527 RepID=UPI000B2E630C|nr:hypothetical protein [Oceanobacillus jeddahense]
MECKIPLRRTILLSDVQDVLGLRLLAPSKTFVRRKAEWLAGAELCTIIRSKKADLTKKQAQ